MTPTDDTMSGNTLAHDSKQEADQADEKTWQGELGPRQRDATCTSDDARLVRDTQSPSKGKLPARLTVGQAKKQKKKEPE